MSIKQFLMKMGNEIAYPMPTKYKIFLGKVALPPYNPLDPGEYLARRPSFPQFKMEWCPYTSMCKGRARPPFLMTVGGNEPLRGIWNWWKKHGISGGNGINWEFITKLCEFYPLKRVFLGFKNTKTHELPVAPPPGPPVPQWNLWWK